MEELKKDGGKKEAGDNIMFGFVKFKIKEYIDMLDESEEMFARQILTIVKKHLERTGRL